MECGVGIEFETGIVRGIEIRLDFGIRREHGPGVRIEIGSWACVTSIYPRSAEWEDWVAYNARNIGQSFVERIILSISKVHFIYTPGQPRYGPRRPPVQSYRNVSVWQHD